MEGCDLKGGKVLVLEVLWKGLQEVRERAGDRERERDKQTGRGRGH